MFYQSYGSTKIQNFDDLTRLMTYGSIQKRVLSPPPVAQTMSARHSGTASSVSCGRGVALPAVHPCCRPMPPIPSAWLRSNQSTTSYRHDVYGPSAFARRVVVGGPLSVRSLRTVSSFLPVYFARRQGTNAPLNERLPNRDGRRYSLPEGGRRRRGGGAAQVISL